LLSYPVYEFLHRLLVRRIEPAGSGAGEVTLTFCSTSLIIEQHLGRPQIGGGGFVDQLMDDRLALGDLARSPSIVTKAGSFNA
jgi:hypothetical protein